MNVATNLAANANVEQPTAAKARSLVDTVLQKKAFVNVVLNIRHVTEHLIDVSMAVACVARVIRVVLGRIDA